MGVIYLRSNERNTLHRKLSVIGPYTITPDNM